MINGPPHPIRAHRATPTPRATDQAPAPAGQRATFRTDEVRDAADSGLPPGGTFEVDTSGEIGDGDCVLVRQSQGGYALAVVTWFCGPRRPDTWLLGRVIAVPRATVSAFAFLESNGGPVGGRPSPSPWVTSELPANVIDFQHWRTQRQRRAWELAE